MYLYIYVIYPSTQPLPSIAILHFDTYLFSSAIQASTMVDLQTVCCMCGDIGFPDKLFHCNRCRNRFQHSYCSNYYCDSWEPMEMCDWCQSEERSARLEASSKKLARIDSANRSEYSGDRIKQNYREESTDKGKNTSSAPSPRPSVRRYKLLKDVMC